MRWPPPRDANLACARAAHAQARPRRAAPPEHLRDGARPPPAPQASDRPRLQRAGDGGPRGARDPPPRPRLRRRGGRRRLHRRHRGRGRGQRRGRPAPPLQHRDRRRDAVRLQVRAPPLLRRRRPGRRRRPAQAGPPARSAGQAPDHRRRGRHGLRQPLPRRSRLQGADRPPDRQPDLLGRPDRDLPPADHRPDLRLPDDQPARDRAVRARLPARLPRGRGDPDAARAPAADPRGAGADERARLRPQLDRLPAQRLLHGQGAAGAVRGPVPAPADPARRAADRPRAAAAPSAPAPEPAASRRRAERCRLVAAVRRRAARRPHAGSRGDRHRA